MWFVFPQLLGLGSSPMAARYGITSLHEARAYLHHDLLGPRLPRVHPTGHQVQGRSITEIFGSPDDLKLCSSMTLFAPGGRRQPRLRRAARQVLQRPARPTDAGRN